MDIGNKLYSLRKEKGLSQEEVSNIIGVSRQTISKWESGLSIPDTDKLISISKLYNISIDKLLNNNIVNNNIVNNDIKYERFHYEYKSKIKIFNLPLIHINIGRGKYKSKGIISIGNIAYGIFTLGIISIGLFAFGILSLGLLLAIGNFSVGVCSIGGLCIGLLSIGGLSIGYFSVGGLACGVYSIGGCSIATKIGMGGYVNAPLIINDQTKNISYMILNKYPDIPDIILNIFSNISINKCYIFY